MNHLLLLSMLAFLTCCTVSMSIVTTEGEASNVGDDTSKASSDITADIPLK